MSSSAPGAYNSGWAAAAAGADRASNPYREGSSRPRDRDDARNYDAWNEGYDDKKRGK